MDDLKTKTAALRERHILDAAIGVFKRDGFREATIRGIARAAGVSEGTIYNVFENKEALLLAALHALLSGVQGSGDRPDTRGEPESAGIGRLFLDRWKSVDAETLEVIRIIWSEALRDPVLAARYLDVIMAPAIAGLGGAGLVPGVDPRIAPRVATAMFLGLVLLKALGDPVIEGSGDEAAALAADVLGQGLVPREQES
jgi:AcrR family transcriptional regulator